MAGLNFNRIAAAATTNNAVANGAVAPNPSAQNAGLNGTQRAQRQPRVDANGNIVPDAQLYLNPVITLPFQHEDGTIEMLDISLPYGLAIDTMGDSERSGPLLNPAKNGFRDMLKQLGASLGQGEAVTLNGSNFPFEVKLELRRKGNATASAGTNPLLAAMQNAIDAFGKAGNVGAQATTE